MDVELLLETSVCKDRPFRNQDEKAKYKKMRAEYKKKERDLGDQVLKEKFAIRDAFKGMASNKGRKKKYTPITLKNRIVDYFAMVKALDKPPTVSGLMVHLKMHRDQFYQYYEYPEFRSIMEQTKLLIENWAEERISLSKYNPSGLIFVLKNRFGWKDLTSVEQTAVTPEDQLLARITALAPGLLGYVQGSANVIEGQIIEKEMEEELSKVDQIDFVKYKEARKKKLTYDEYIKREEQGSL